MSIPPISSTSGFYSNQDPISNLVDQIYQAIGNSISDLASGESTQQVCQNLLTSLDFGFSMIKAEGVPQGAQANFAAFQNDAMQVFNDLNTNAPQMALDQDLQSLQMSYFALKEVL